MYKSLYRGLNTGFSHINHPDGLNNTLLFHGYVLEATPSGRTYIPRIGDGGGASNCPGQVRVSNGTQVFLMTFSNSYKFKGKEIC